LKTGFNQAFSSLKYNFNRDNTSENRITWFGRAVERMCAPVKSDNDSAFILLKF